jgi:hypothetical protein
MAATSKDSASSPLGPCPFCSAENAVVLTLTQGMYIVQCGCSAQGPWAQTPALAVAAWQSRGVLPWRTCPACRRHFIPKTRRQRYDSRRCAWRGWSHNKRMAQSAEKGEEG